MEIQKTVVILKPDALQRDLLGEIIQRFERKGLKIVGLKLMQLTKAVLDEHYAHHIDKPFYPGMRDFMMQNPVVVLALEGFGAVDEVRKIVGATDPQKADAGTIRADFSMKISSNLIHASDGTETAQAEVGRFFSKNEIFAYEKITDKYLFGEGT